MIYLSRAIAFPVTTALANPPILGVLMPSPVDLTQIEKKFKYSKKMKKYLNFELKRRKTKRLLFPVRFWVTRQGLTAPVQWC